MNCKGAQTEPPSRAIANIAAKGHPTLSEYNYTDWTASNGNNFYRLKMIDKDGTSEFSSIILIKFNGNLNANIEIAPNPVQASFVVKFAGMEKGLYRLRLINQQGPGAFCTGSLPETGCSNADHYAPWLQ